MADPSKHGLPRHIPADIALEVRRRSGFGCVFCGLFICDYEHIEPEFNDAHSHDADCICLICPNHHRKVSNGLISKQDVFAAYANPRALQDGFAQESADFARLKRPCRISIGSLTFEDPGEILRVEDLVILGLGEVDGCVTLNGVFFDRAREATAGRGCR